MAAIETTPVIKRRSVLQSDAAQKILAFAGLIILVIVFSLASPYFFTFDNVMGILVSTAVNGVLALGVTFVIVTGGIDLSVGTVMAFSAVTTAYTVTNMGLPLPVGITVGILTGAVAGLFNGLLISRLNIPPFIATLGTMMIAKGLALVVSDKAPIYFDDTPIFRQIMLGSVVQSLIPELKIPNAVFIFLGAALIAAFILSKTVLGRYTVAIGSNEEATRLSGINVAAWKTAVYTLGGIFSGLAGIMIASRLNSAQPATGPGYELEAIAAVVIGGTSLSGGEGTILGTVIGAFVISTLTNGLRILSVPQEWQTVVTGAIVVLAVYLDLLRRRRQ